jgi:DNA primase
VYQALLAQLPLSQAHREQLRGRGLPDDRIDRGGYGTMPRDGRTCARVAAQLAEHFGGALLTVPGIIGRERDGRRWLTLAGGAGLLVPCRDLAGRIVALKVRRDDPGGRRCYLYLSSRPDGAGPGAPVHVPLGITAPAAVVRVTEGELKADVSYLLSEIPTISAPGASSWREMNWCSRNAKGGRSVPGSGSQE